MALFDQLHFLAEALLLQLYTEATPFKGSFDIEHNDMVAILYTLHSPFEAQLQP